ncbi:putative stabilization of polarity axis [Lyophyllum shimeji]|uniref:Stabilization of polarity axis n=1 Tax=Lyophyllum shimeji TaxID=47721 RepID=A0A9P3UQF8_LYOSH|nr:putative stabilization of polarity axis [Lyophyllum shimeji]
MPRADLKLDELYEQEEDIGEASPYLGVVHTPASSTTVSSTEGSITTATPARAGFPESFEVPHIPPSISRKKSLGQLNSPSSPSLPKLNRPAALSRSQTLPRVTQLESKPRRRQAELSQLDANPETIEKIRRWIIGIAIVDFDVDDGPVIDGIYPPSMVLPAEAENLAFSSFPDSLQFDQGSQCHSFRIRELNSVHAEKRPPTKDGFIYGHAYFTQRRDSASKRGYEQRSVVILTQHQFPAFFSLLISIFGPLFQQHELPMLESACQNIAKWRDPTPGEILELGFLGSVLRVVIPRTTDEQQFTPSPAAVGTYDPKHHIAASSSPLMPPPMVLFETALSQLCSSTSTVQRSPSVPPAGPAPGWKSKTHKRYISKDRALLKQLETALRGDERAKLNASLALRRHFHSRTSEVITPLARYLNTLIPTPTEVAKSSTDTLRLKPFSSANFFASLKAHGSTLPFRSTSKRIEFYERLLKTPSFGLWLAQQERIVEGVLKEKRTV